jgi:hypothetical protein
MSKQAEGLFLPTSNPQCLLAFFHHPFLLPSSALAFVSSPLLAFLPSVMLSSTTLPVCIFAYSLILFNLHKCELFDTKTWPRIRSAHYPTIGRKQFDF